MEQITGFNYLGCHSAKKNRLMILKIDYKDFITRICIE
jgi:hypothetical protein